MALVLEESTMSERTRSSFLNTANRSSSIFFGIIAVVYLYLCFMMGWNLTETGERLIYIRYLNFVITGFFAFIIPHVFFPDSNRYLLQTFNLSGADQLRYFLKKVFPVITLISTGIVMIAFADEAGFSSHWPEKALSAIIGILFVWGMALVSLFHYAEIGKRSQDWQEGNKGEKFIETLKQVGAAPSVPAGSLPSLLTTTLLAIFGMMFIVGGAYVSAVTGLLWLEMLPGVILVGYATARFLRISGIFDSFFYRTNAFYQELFLNPKAFKDGREPLKVNALYWVPSPLKTATWFSLLQLDRKLPLGRIMIVAHLILWTLFYSQPGMAVIHAWLLLMILGKSMILYLLISKPFAPVLFQYRLLPPIGWIGVRFFVNFRWIPLMGLSLWIVSWFSEAVSLSFIGNWMLIDGGISLVTAIFFTLLHEYRFKSAYA